MSATLPRGGNENVRIARVHHHVGNTRAFGDGDERGPRFAAIGGLVQPAVTAIGPQRSLRGHVHHIAVTRVNHNARNVLGRPESHALPVLAGVVGAIHAVAVGHAALRVVFAGAHPHGVGLALVEYHRANGVRRLLVEDGCPGRAAVVGLEYAAGRDADIHDARIDRVHGDAGDATTGDRGADESWLEQGAQGAGDAACGGRVATFGARGIQRRRGPRLAIRHGGTDGAERDAHDGARDDEKRVHKHKLRVTRTVLRIAPKVHSEPDWAPPCGEVSTWAPTWAGLRLPDPHRRSQGYSVWNA